MNNINISNFRKVKNSWDLDLAPITFFTGTNNSGKSTVFKALLILEDHINSENHFELDFNGENARKHKVDCFDNAINRINQNQKNKDLIFQYSNQGFDVKFHFQPSEDKANGKGKLIKLELKRFDGAKVNIYQIGGASYQLQFDDVLVERINETKNTKQKIRDEAIVRTIQNLIVHSQQELDQRKSFTNQIESRISELDFEDNINQSKEQFKDDERILFRLNKVLKELNISLDRAVDYLNSMGFDVEARPTTKVDLFTYNILRNKFALDGSRKTAANNLRLTHLQKELRINNQKIISLNQDLLDSRKKLQTAIRKLESSNNIEKSINTYSPEFSLDDFHPSERTIDRIIRKILPKYLQENDKSIELSGVRGGNIQAIRLGERIKSAMFFSVDHLSPHRNNQTRLYINSNTSSDINELIKINSTRPINKQSKAGKFLKEWMRKFDIGDDYRIKSIDGVATKIEIVEDGTWVNMVDKGFGAGQIFSILFKIALSIDDTRSNSKFRFTKNRKELIVIEEPEANLHPALQSKLTELFYAAYREFDIRFIIETHSEYALRKSQVFVKGFYENNLKQENIPFAVYYFDKDKGPHKMNYREDGVFKEDFGTGFFDVASSQSIELLKRRKLNG